MNYGWTPDSAAKMVAAYASGDPDWKAAVVAKMVATDSALFHAASLVALDRPPTTTCSFCGALYKVPDHWPVKDHALCVARAKRGMPTPPIPWVVTCDCAICRGKPVLTGFDFDLTMARDRDAMWATKDYGRPRPAVRRRYRGR